MATEILVVPEEKLLEVIRVIRVGLTATYADADKKILMETRRQLKKWCDEEERYIKS